MIAAALAALTMATPSGLASAHQSTSKLSSLSDTTCRQLTQMAHGATQIEKVRFRASTNEPVDMLDDTSEEFTDGKCQFVFLFKDVVTKGDISYVRGTFSAHQVPTVGRNMAGVVGWSFTRTAP